MCIREAVYIVSSIRIVELLSVHVAWFASCREESCVGSLCFVSVAFSYGALCVDTVR